MYGHTCLPAVAQIPVYREFSSGLSQGRHPPNPDPLRNTLMQEWLNTDVGYIQKPVQYRLKQTTAVLIVIVEELHAIWLF